MVVVVVVIVVVMGVVVRLVSGTLSNSDPDGDNGG